MLVRGHRAVQLQRHLEVVDAFRVNVDPRGGRANIDALRDVGRVERDGLRRVDGRGRLRGRVVELPVASPLELAGRGCRLQRLNLLAQIVNLRDELRDARIVEHISRLLDSRDAEFDLPAQFLHRIQRLTGLVLGGGEREDDIGEGGWLQLLDVRKQSLELADCLVVLEEGRELISTDPEPSGSHQYARGSTRISRFIADK